MQPFFIGVVVSFAVTVVWFRSRSSDGVDVEFDMIHCTLNDLLRQLKVVHNGVFNPHIAPNDVRQDVNRGLLVLSRLMLQLVHLSRLSKRREVRKKWDKLPELVEQLDEHLHDQLIEMPGMVPTWEAIGRRDNDETIMWFN